MESYTMHKCNISAPNLIVVCVDQIEAGEISGQFYHCYKEDPVTFVSAVELVMRAERLFDAIAYPQASTESRSFFKSKEYQNYNKKRPKQQVTAEELLAHKGALETFALSVSYRQNATWQGEIQWMRDGSRITFKNELELLSGIDCILTRRDT